MIDPTLIFFAALAAFLCYRLYSVLGTRDGHEPDDADHLPQEIAPGPGGRAEDEGAPPIDPSPKPVPAWAETVRREDDPSFDPDHFITGARSAYEMIVQAFAKGDFSDMGPYIAQPVQDAFATAVDAREANRQSLEVTFVGIESANVEDTIVKDGQVYVVIAFQSDQIRVVRDDEGQVVDGDPNRIELVRDRWTFSRRAGSKDPNWVLTATDGAAPSAD